MNSEYQYGNERANSKIGQGRRDFHPPAGGRYSGRRNSQGRSLPRR